MKMLIICSIFLKYDLQLLLQKNIYQIIVRLISIIFSGQTDE